MPGRMAGAVFFTHVHDCPDLAPPQSLQPTSPVNEQERARKEHVREMQLDKRQSLARVPLAWAEPLERVTGIEAALSARELQTSRS
jgi:hypothetical protein